ncbi:hypothetical protein NC652_006605 [Populus alba x Populus x berolinensis]|nr:hypothetical protein NC652_006605 [Populus alba x Populus x berolinensis]
MKIKVWVYKKTIEERFATLKKYSDKAPPTDIFATHEVKLDYEYKSVEDPNKVVNKELGVIDMNHKLFQYHLLSGML